jgi:hypothetical protein
MRRAARLGLALVAGLVATAPVRAAGPDAALSAPASPDAGLSPRAADFYRGTDLARDGHAAEAVAVFRALVEQAPGDAFADDALFELARLEEEQLAQPLAAARDYQRLAHDYPDSRLALRAERRAQALALELGPGGEHAAEAAEWGTIFHGFAGRPRAETIEQARAFLARHPDFPDAAEASFWLATLEREEGQTGDALARARTLARDPAAGEWATRARVLEGDLLLAAGNVDGAAEAYQVAGHAEGLARVTRERWRGRAVAVAWIVVLLAAGAALTAVRRAPGGWRGLLVAPGELLYLAPVALCFAAAGLTENVVLGHAVEIIAAGGLMVAWLSGAALDAARARAPISGRRAAAHAVVAAAAVLAVCVIAVTRERLIDQLVETLRFGADR